ncbi:DAK2 domain-containing protein [Ornithinimicrobium pekingense]|uniref:Dihydroxyacetone kinase n=1 Tax=Ornithinimicrobium pekingense TaxID=384677 RepID=A0ABQ2F804_9MICO|nr:DAK2 domain-containing protein [Ornithinimicrobium pekingense]GGK62741.1 dihydroxyacetone kinase [Ornithinimicrobium pekingense]
MSRPALDLVTARRWAVTARVMLAGAREQIDALNVFPVADGDTGTNMYLTMDGALEFVRGQFELGAGTESLDEGLALIARGMLLSARGNSGVILSQLTRGLSDSVGPQVAGAGPEELAVAFETAARTAWDAIAAPVEGTILSVARAAAEGARAAVERGRPLYGDEEELGALHVVREALEAARQALAHTPEQLPALRHAGVVDAGGAGLVLVIEALEAVLEDRPHRAVTELPAWWELPARRRGGAAPSTCAAGEPDAGAGSIEVMYLLTDSDDERAGRLRAHLTRLGTSVAVAGGPADYRVHVHLDDPRLAVEAGTMAGAVHDVRLTSLADGRELEPLPGPAAPGERSTGQAAAAGQGYAVASCGGDAAGGRDARFGVVACGLGKGVEGLLAGAGAQVVPSGPRRRASAGQLLAAVWACDASRVVLLPNDGDTVMVAMAAAEAAAREGVRVDVVPSRTLVQGLAALAVLDLEGDPDRAVAAMTEAAEAVRPGAVTRAERPAETAAGPVAPGQWIGIVGQDVVAVDDDLDPVAARVLDLLWHDGAEVLTVLSGTRAQEGALDAVLQDLLSRHPGTEVTRIEGGQPTYPYLLGVE